MPLIEKQSIKSLNKTVLVVKGLLSLMSLVMIYSATSGQEAATFKFNFFWKQLLWVVGSFIMLILVAQVNYEVWLGLSPYMYYSTIGLLLVLLIVGRTVIGSVRWFHIGPVAFQPSEFAKVALTLMLTKFIADNKGKIDLLQGMLKTFAIVSVPMFLILIQPDLGTAMIFIPSSPFS